MNSPLLEQVSSYAGDIDFVIFLIAVIVFFWFFVAEGVFFWFILKYRAKPGVKADYVTGKEPGGLKQKISMAHYAIIALDVVIIVAAVRVWYMVKMNLPPADEGCEVRVVSQQWSWSFQYPGADNTFDTEDDIKTVDELHLEVGKTYHYHLTSKDVLHCFSVPVFRLKQDAIPGRIISGWFKPEQTGTHDLQCAEMCGIGHGLMFGKVVIEDSQQHAEWLKAAAPQ